MKLDQETIYFVTGVFMLLSGVMLLATNARGRLGRWVGVWGLATIAVGLGNFDYLVAGIVPLHALKSGANMLQVTGWIVAVQGFRLFVGRRPRWPLVVLAILPFWIVPLIFYESAAYPLRVAHNDILIAICDAWVAAEAIILARRERLNTAWIMAGLCLLIVPLALARGAMAIATMAGHDLLRTSVLAPSLAALLSGVWALRVSVPMLIMAERSHHRLSFLATHDPLTGALNRAGLDDLRGAMAGSAALLLMDLDHFKALNDRYGHGMGDAALRLFAGVVRLLPGGEGYFVRLGGDEFLLVLPGRDLAWAARTAEAVRASFAARVAMLAIDEPQPTLSIGVAEGSVDRVGLGAILSAADAALYQAKQAGRDRVACAT